MISAALSTLGWLSASWDVFEISARGENGIELCSTCPALLNFLLRLFIKAVYHQEGVKVTLEKGNHLPSTLACQAVLHNDLWK